VALAHLLKVRAIAEARIKTDKISADILADLLRTNLLPEAYVPAKETREAKNVLRQRMFFVRVQTMVKNRIYAVLDRHPEIVPQAPDVSDLFGASGMEWLKQAVLPGEDNRLLASELDLLEMLRRKVSESDRVVKELAKRDSRVKLLRSIPGVGPFFPVLILYEIDDISRCFRGKVFHGRITKQGNKWLRWALVEAVQPAIRADGELYAYHQRVRSRKSANAAKVATARRLLTIVYRVLSQQRFYQREARQMRQSLTPAALVTS